MKATEGIPYFETRTQLHKDFPFKIFRYSSQLLKQNFHMHDYVQLAYVYKGMCNHRMHGKSLTVSQGDLFVITPGTGHSFSAIEDKEFELVLIDFAPDLLGEHFAPAAETLKPFLEPGRDFSSQSWLHIGKNRQRLVVELLTDLQDEFETKDVGYEYSIRLTLVKLLLIVDRESRRMQRKSERPQAAGDRQPIEEVQRYIRDNYSQDIPLERGAYIASMAPAYFSHMFKKATGQSFVDYINEVRIEQAMALIRRDSLTITQIGFQVGYRHLSHFIRTFKKRTGITPTEYKKAFGGRPEP